MNIQPITLFTDPHLGTRRTTHTTPESRRRLQQALFDQALNIVNQYPNCMCLGDLFDNYSNPEHIISQGKVIVEMCSHVMAGNHDVTPRASELGSLQLLQSVPGLERKVVLSKYGEIEIRKIVTDHGIFFMVPHVTDMDLFLRALGEAYEQAVNVEGKAYLLLHCNYDLPDEFMESETALNLDKDTATSLLSRFNNIFIGHDHAPREDGDVIILGNTHPTGFSDISDKRIIQINDGELTEEIIWSKKDHYAKLDVNSDALEIGKEIQFVDLTGDVPASEVPVLSMSIVGMWKNNPGLMAVRNSVSVEGANVSDRRSHDIDTLPRSIEKELRNDKEALVMWKQLVEEVNNAAVS